MVRALDGLAIETESVFQIFFWMVILFQLSSFSLSYLIMTQDCAIVCSIIFVFGLYLWYYQWQQ